MTARGYNQFCGVARALDLIGERWSLLIVRDLLDGPKRYSDLLHSLAGIPSDMLANRLRNLESAGLVQRAVLPPPAASKVYELTDRGKGLEAALVELSRWGVELLDAPTPADSFRSQWMALSLRSRFRPAHTEGVELTVHFEVDGETLAATIHNGRLTTRAAEPGESPDVTVAGDPAAFAAAARGEPVAGRLRISGKPAALAKFAAAFESPITSER